MVRASAALDAEKMAVITLCLLGPITTPVIALSMSHSYPVDLTMMVFNLSSLVSVLAMNLIATLV